MVKDILRVLQHGGTQLYHGLIPARRRWALFYPALIISFSILGSVLQLEEYNKRNLANWIFTRFGWLLTITPLLALQFRNKQPEEQQERTVSFIRIALATVYWYMTTQYAVGTLSEAPPKRGHGSLMDHLDTRFGSCSIGSINSKTRCADEGGEWQKFDASGHCFLAVHGSLLMIEELKRMRRQWSQMDDIDRALYSVVIGVLTAWLWMLVFTSLYFHTVMEKIIGLLLGQLFWLLIARIEA